MSLIIDAKVSNSQDNMDVDSQQDYMEIDDNFTTSAKNLDYIGITTTLLDYQVEGVEKILQALKKYGGSILADEQGLGKTLQSLTVALALCYNYETRREVFNKRLHIDENMYKKQVLIICEKSGIGVWKEQISLHTEISPEEVSVYQGTKRTLQDTLFTIVSYETAREDKHPRTKKNLAAKIPKIIEALFEEKKWTLIIFDEIHKAKNCGNEFLNNDGSKIFHTLYEFDESIPKLALTGTPMNNSIRDVKAEFILVLKQVEKFTTDEYWDSLTHKDIANIRENFIIRRTLESVQKELKLPALRIENTFVDLSEYEFSVYKSGVEKTQKAYRDYMRSLNCHGNPMRIRRSKEYFVQCLMALRRHATHPSAWDPSVSEDERDLLSSKLQLAYDLCFNYIIEGKSIVVFGTFVKPLQILMKSLSCDMCRLYCGDLSVKERGEILEDFKNKVFPVLLISTGSGKTGLTLTTASRMILLDSCSDPNPSTEDQAIKRVHRIGSTEAVVIHRLITRNTIDEAVALTIHQTRRENINAFLDQPIDKCSTSKAMKENSKVWMKTLELFNVHENEKAAEKTKALQAAGLKKVAATVP
jgi:SNF2 family DNA or RNA helicase